MQVPPHGGLGLLGLAVKTLEPALHGKRDAHTDQAAHHKEQAQRRCHSKHEHKGGNGAHCHGENLRGHGHHSIGHHRDVRRQHAHDLTGQASLGKSSSLHEKLRHVGPQCIVHAHLGAARQPL